MKPPAVPLQLGKNRKDLAVNSMVQFDLSRRLLAELLGTMLLLTIVVGSGIMGDQLAGGNTAIALLANSLATGAGLVVLILMFGSISGAHFNPVVTLVESLKGSLSKQESILYVLVQIGGAVLGILVAHAMFGLAPLEFSSHSRTGLAQWFSEFVASFALIAVIKGVGRAHKAELPYAVGAYIASAYWFTASTSFANPAVTFARAFTPTFAGIMPADVLGFVIAQVLGALAAHLLFLHFEKALKEEISP